MFTGIVEETGRVTAAEADSGNLRLTVAAAKVSGELAVGDSISVSGCCLTVVEAVGGPNGWFAVELSLETIGKTADRWRVDARVNLERAMQVGGRLGGHLVSGHVDGVGDVLEVEARPGAFLARIRAPAPLARHLVPKGSITVDGVSLTLVDVGGPAGTRADWPATDFSLWLIPHTLEVTTLGELSAGSKVNLESDLIAKYLERLTLMSEEATDARAS